MKPKYVYVDSSCLVAIAFEEPGAEVLIQRLAGYEQLFASNLLEAEFRSSLAREGLSGGGELLAAITWIFPNRPLRQEIEKAAAHGYLKGADLWHLACALYLAGGNPEKLGFETLDRRQGQVAVSLGFQSATS